LTPAETLSAAVKLPRGRAAVPAAEVPGEEVLGRIVTVNAKRLDLYAYWRDFSNLPRFMHHVKSVATLDSITSHWVMLTPGGGILEWDAIVIDDVPGRAIAWTSVDNASVRNSGRVEFRDALIGRGTEVAATILYDAPARAARTQFAAQLQKALKAQVRRDLQCLKQIMEGP
jgi:uncharacterized membrane protein